MCATTTVGPGVTIVLALRLLHCKRLADFEQGM
jgi:hypothetical protein